MMTILMKWLINKCTLRMVLIFCILVTVPFILLADDLDEAVREAVEILDENGLSKFKTSKIFVEIRNYDSDKVDRDAQIIRDSLYKALTLMYQHAEIIKLENSIAGVSLNNVIIISGKYRLMGEDTVILIEAQNGSSATLIAKADATYESLRQVEDDLVVVMDIFSPYLTEKYPGKEKAFSRIFKTAISKTNKFKLISSDAVDSSDANAIQKKYNCTREECGTIIAQQLRASKVINITYEKITDDLFYLSGNIKDINSGRSLVSESVEHDGNFRTLKSKLEKLACKLAKTCGKPVQSIVRIRKSVPKFQPVQQQQYPEQTIESDDGWPWWYWAAGAVVVGIIGVAVSGNSEDDSSSTTSSTTSDSCPSGAGTCGSTEYTW